MIAIGDNVRIWIRLGVTLNVPPDEAARIMEGDEETLRSVISGSCEGGEWHADGESYIPGEVAEALGYECVDVEFNL